MNLLQEIRQELGSPPVTEGHIGGRTALYAERYLLSGHGRSVSGLPVMAISVQLGGARVLEGEAGKWRSNNLPNKMLLIPPDCPTLWHYSGSVDVGNFFFIGPLVGIAERLFALLGSSKTPLSFSDSLVGSATLQVFAELEKGSAADDEFIEKLVDVLLEQAYRVLTIPNVTGLSPSHVHFVRLQKVLAYIRGNPGSDLSSACLADLAGVSPTHFRRLFQQELGSTVHQYVQTARLEQARKYLASTAMPISKIAEECGFSSQSHLTTSFRKLYAVTPAEYRSQLGK